MYNSPERIALRRHQNTLIVAGSGIIIFGLWTIIKVISRIFLYRTSIIASIRRMMGPQAGAVSDTLIFTVLLVIFSIGALILFGIRLYIGLSAIAEGRGRRVLPFYIPVTIILCFFSVLDTLRSIIRLFDPPESLEGIILTDTGIIAAAIELTSLIILIQMAIAAVRVRKVKQQLAVSGE